MFILCFYSFKNVGALNAVRSNRSLKKIAIIERLLFEEGRKDYGSVMKTGKTTDRISVQRTYKKFKVSASGSQERNNNSAAK